jgi:glycolate oxidase iron-sulfur subunit
MKTAEETRDMLLSELAKCRACRFCLDTCPTYQASAGLETLSSCGRLQTLRYLLMGMLRLDDSLAYILYSCLDCKRCEIMCKSKGQGLEITSLIQMGRALLSDRLLKGEEG